MEQAESPPNKKTDNDEIAKLKDEITMIKKNMSLKSKSRGQKAKIYNWSKMTRK